MGDYSGSYYNSEEHGGQVYDEFTWNGALAKSGSFVSLTSSTGSVTPYYNVAPGSEVTTGLPNNQAVSYTHLDVYKRQLE